MESVGPTKVATKPAWGTLAFSNVLPLAEVMSEELAKTMQHKEDELAWKVSLDEVQADTAKLDGGNGEGLAAALEGESGEADGCSSDYLIAQLLQTQFDREHDDRLKREERKFNREAKVSISLSNYRRMPETYKYETDSDDDDSEDDTRDWDAFETSEKAFPVIPRCGYKKQGDTLVTKHDITMSNRRNACRVMEFPPGIETGDGGGFDMQLSNKVFNSLKVYSHVEADRHAKLHDKTEKSTAEMALDPKTRLILYKMVNNRVLDQISGCVSTGKEAIVMHADGCQEKNVGVLQDDGEWHPKSVPAECAVKIFKTTLNEFKNRDRYIRDDYRFKARFSKQNPRKIIHMWAEKEMHNLARMERAGIPCPAVVQLKKHVLVMSFIGTNMMPAPKLKEALMPFSDMCMAYEQTVDAMQKMFNECNLVHADLSEYNILWHEQKCWFIDVSQSVDKSHPHALEFLYRDCTNISNFFTKKGVPDVKSTAELFKSICNLEVSSSDVEALSQIQDYEENEELLTHGLTEKEFPFEASWEEVKRGGKFGGKAGRAPRRRNKSFGKDDNNDGHHDPKSSGNLTE